ncbi:peptidoglycan DD-metalloendopeptidase family protein [Aeromonas rivuli]|jgi:lipoprotein NlpD|uniref:peptidoglycan DD-metalloendopeptidase family protein n=1 Tax=Aeromonas rivuli TaxID=648794 RepID=UPI0005A6A55B|nr:peptidoglycan DD-metalloendopeptidase family protein [Aeromonas rivuli]
MNGHIWRGCAVTLLSGLLAACSSSTTPAPVQGLSSEGSVRAVPSRQGSISKPTISGRSYTVKRGDTLYSIAFNAGSDVPSLANLNGIGAPYNIHPGQVIRLDGAEGSPVMVSSTSSGSAARTYQVRRGDTLSSIGRQFGVANQTLAQRNNLSAPYNLNVGQTLNVGGSAAASGTTMAVASSRPTSTATTPVSTGTTSAFVTNKSVAQPAPKAYAGTSVQNNNSVTQNNNNASSSRLAWHWPAQGRIVEGFSVAEQGNKGIDIAGQKGQPVYAASGGKVVYAGSALRGYGKLVILKHDDDYLSAYAHNDALRVREGDVVKGGAVIADMGSTDAPDVRLHFEIRYRGKSINPMGYLPKR